MKTLKNTLISVAAMFAAALASADEASVKINLKKSPEVPIYFSAEVGHEIKLSGKAAEHSATVAVKMVQGEAEVFSFALLGDGEVGTVEPLGGEQGGVLKSWSVRSDGEQRFLDIAVSKVLPNYQFRVTATQTVERLPSEFSLLHLGPGDAVGFSAETVISLPVGLVADFKELSGLTPTRRAGVESERVSLLGTGPAQRSLTTTTGGEMRLELRKDGIINSGIELREAALSGQVSETGEWVDFNFTGTVISYQDGTELPLLSGAAALAEMPDIEGLRFELRENQYFVKVAKAGQYEVCLSLVAELQETSARSSLSFQIPAATVLPIALRGLGDVGFSDELSVQPIRVDDVWEGYVPASGEVMLAWSEGAAEEDGALFFSSEGVADIQMGAGLLRQNTVIEIKVLQGELSNLTLATAGPGEVLAVDGADVLSWGRTDTGLNIQFREAVDSGVRLIVRSQLALGEFPVTVESLRVSPVGTVRHAGFLRIRNEGAVRLDVRDLEGLMQLPPEQFPGGTIEARQLFAYRFPATDYQFAVEASRIVPEVTVSEVLVYELSDSDRAIRSDIELDIREAPLREWEIEIPSDYSVVSVAGARVGDYVVGAESQGGVRLLRVLFSEEVTGRQLINLHLEKNETVTEGAWALARIKHPAAKAVRGDVGVVSAAGFRIKVETTAELAEKPLSFFLKKEDGLQLAFRIRERDWTAALAVERLPRSVEADVFHLYSLKDGTAYGSVVVNYFITGSPVDEWRLRVPSEAGNVSLDGQNVRTWRREGDEVIVTLQQPVIGLYTLLLTCEEPVGTEGGVLQPGRVTPLGVRDERGYVQVVSPVQVKTEIGTASEGLLKLDALELPAEFRLSSSAPSLAVYQYTSRPFELAMNVEWYEPGETIAQVVEFAEARSRISRDGEVVTDATYSVKTRDGRLLRLDLPEAVRLWEVRVDGVAVTARRDGDATLIPLPAGTDANKTVEVSIRYGRAATDPDYPQLALPAVSAPILKTEWTIEGDEQRHLSLEGEDTFIKGSTGFAWIAEQAAGSLAIALLLIGIAIALGKKFRFVAILFLLSAGLAIGVLALQAYLAQPVGSSELTVNVPVLTANEVVSAKIGNFDKRQLHFDIWGATVAVVGGIWFVLLMLRQRPAIPTFLSFLLVSGGLLWMEGGALYFAVFLGCCIFLLMLQLSVSGKGSREEFTESSATGVALLLGAVLCAGGDCASAAIGHADRLEQTWHVEDGRVLAEGQLTLQGEVGESFFFLSSEAILKSFQGEGLRVDKVGASGYRVTLVALPKVVGSLFSMEDPFSGMVTPASERAPVSEREASFSYELKAGKGAQVILLPTASATVNVLSISTKQEGLTIASETAAKVETSETGQSARVLFLPGREASVSLSPRQRDPLKEDVAFFVEVENGYVSGPGLLEGVHRISIRPSQGVVRRVNLMVPEGLTVSGVGEGPVADWRFSGETGRLVVELKEAQAGGFHFTVSTQQSLGKLPLNLTVKPLRVLESEQEVGLLGLAFRGQAQAESISVVGLLEVNLADFAREILPAGAGVLHRAYRYGVEDASAELRIIAVQPELRVSTSELLSVGAERTVLKIDLNLDITRAGIFRYGFNIPEGYEIESLSGESMSHFTEDGEGAKRSATVHLKGQTEGPQSFALVLVRSGAAESNVEWVVPRVTVTEAARQTGQLVVNSEQGFRLRTLDRKHVSEVDPRTVGRMGENAALAFRLLQKEWQLTLGIEKLEPWVTGQMLHELTLREGQTRHVLIAALDIEHAAVQSVRVAFPNLSEEEAKTLRVSGSAVSAILPVEGEPGLWEITFKRRVIGAQQVRLEWERTGERDKGEELVQALRFPELRQTSYYVALRAGAQLEVTLPELSSGWYRLDWTAVATPLRDAAAGGIPAMALRAGEEALRISVTRHSVAEALKLRVTEGKLTTVVSPMGDLLTAVTLQMNVIQRSTLRVAFEGAGNSAGKGKGGLFNVFVNGESVSVVRDGDGYLFYVMPGMGKKAAEVEFAYAQSGEPGRSLALSTPQLSVPLENIEWRVIVPEGFEIDDVTGDLELEEEEGRKFFGKDSYKSSNFSRNVIEKEKAQNAFDQADQLLKAGRQGEALQLYQNVANNFNLDEATNEDARVKLERVQTDQVIAGLNSRRQRLYLDNRVEDAGVYQNAELELAAASNSILQGEVNFRPDELSSLLRGNSQEENQFLLRIADRLVKHQKATELAAQAISVPVPEEGKVYLFRRSVRVDEGAPLKLEMNLQRPGVTEAGNLLLGICLAAFGAAIFAWGYRRLG